MHPLADPALVRRIPKGDLGGRETLPSREVLHMLDSTGFHEPGPFMRASTRSLLFGVALGALVLSAISIGGAAVALRQLDITRDATVARTQESVAAVLTDVQSALRREAKLLAKAPALVEGVARGDWAVVARGASPRLAGLTLERMADLVAVLDGSGTTILQVPASPPLSLADPASLASSSSTVTLLDGQPYVAAAAPVTGETDPAAGRSGLVLVARRLDGALSLLPGVADRPGIVFVERGKPVFSSLPLPEGGWAKAAASGS